MAQTSLNSTGVASSGALSLQSNGTTEAIGISTGQVATLAQNPILTSGTANGVAYLNGSKVVTSGSALTYDGTTFGVGSGSLRIDATSNIYGKTDNTSFVSLYGGGAYNSGAGIGLGGTSNSGSPNTIIFTRGSYVETARFDASGNLGLGVTPSAWGGSYKGFQVAATGAVTSNGSNATGIGHNYYYDGTNNKYLTTGAANLFLMINNEHRWYTAPSGTAGNAISFTQAMTLDASGNLGVGTTSPTAGVHLQKSSGNTYYRSQNNLTNVDFGTDGAGTGILWNNGNYPLAFGTNNIERARIDSSGNLLVGTTTSSVYGVDFKQRVVSSGGFVSQIQGAGSTSEAVQWVHNTNTSGTRGLIQFIVSGSSTVGKISSDGSSTTYGTSSDYRLKENIQPLVGAIDKVLNLRPVTYKWKNTGSVSEGFIAHELAEVCPHAVVGEKDEVDSNGKPIYQGIDTSFLVATLTAAIQELNAKFEAYKAAHP